jgi:flagellar M-ring protein FliF
MKGGQELNKQEVASITHFVAAAVPGLRASRVTVVDSYGRLLARGDGQEGSGAIAAAGEEFRVAYENRTRDTLETMLEKVVGPGKVKVQVAADINFDRIESNTEKFDPEGQVIRSVQSTTERDDEKDSAGKESVTVANQQPGGAAAGGGAGGAQRNAEKSGETTNYEISKTVEKHVKEGGKVNRLSVAVLVDGVYDDENRYQARNEDDIKRLESLVKSAIVFDEKRGDSVQVVNMQFTKVETTQEEEEGNLLANIKQEFEAVIQTLIIAAVAILAIMVVLRPAILHMMKTSASTAARTNDGMAALSAPGGAATQVIMRLPGAGGMAGDMAPGSAATTILQMGSRGGGGGSTTVVEEEEDDMIDLENIKGRVKSSSLRKVKDFVDKNPEEAMGVVRQWMMKDSSS